MYIKIETRTDEGQPRGATYECTEFFTVDAGDTGFLLTINRELKDGNGYQHDIRVKPEDRPFTRIYVMNEQGKTIDRYNWT